MQLLLVRHAIAEDRLEFAASGLPDEERPLTGRGRRGMAVAAAGILRAQASLSVIACSPLVRARQTADLLAARYPGARREVLPALAPDGAREDLLAWLRGLVDDAVAVVGHEPDLGRLASWLLSGHAGGWLEFKKGAACLLAFDGRPAPGAALLRWHLAPRQLRLLAEEAS